MAHTDKRCWANMLRVAGSRHCAINLTQQPTVQRVVRTLWLIAAHAIPANTNLVPHDDALTAVLDSQLVSEDWR